MDFIRNCALNRKVNTIANSAPEAVSVHQWVCSLDMNSPAEYLNAARRDAEEAGLVFALMRLGAEAYGLCLKKLYPRLAGLALTEAMGSDEWWWSLEAPDRAKGLLLHEFGGIESRPFGAGLVPVAAPVGLDYSDLLRGHLRASPFCVRGPERR